MTTATVNIELSLEQNSHLEPIHPLLTELVLTISSLPQSDSALMGLQDNHPRIRLGSLARGKRLGGVQGRAAAPSAGHLRRKGCRGRLGHRAAGADNRARADSSPRDWDAAAPPGPPAAATPAARESRPRWQALYSVVPPCRLSRQRRAAGAGHLLTLTRPSPKASPFSVEKLPGSRSRGGGHTNSSGHLLLPGACGVQTPRRRSEPACTERQRRSPRGREEEQEGGAPVRGRGVAGRGRN